MDELYTYLKQSLDDTLLDKQEKKQVREYLKDQTLSVKNQSLLLHTIFTLAKEASESNRAKLLDWLEDVVKSSIQAQQSSSKVYFSPGPDCLNAIIESLSNAKKQIEVCVFTISDNRISEVLTVKHREGVQVRIITDNDKRYDKGSDIEYLYNEGIAVRIDETPHHMHHKFAVIDREITITGSYNWTRSAEQYNQENVLITDNLVVVEKYIQEFERLWSKLHAV